jgi:Flp pilus assembly pilin Flp
MRFLRDESGQTAAEYLGMVLVVAALLGAVVALDIGQKLTGTIEQAVCAVADLGPCEPSEAGAPGGEDSPTPRDPELTAEERGRLLGDPEGAQQVLRSLTPEEREWLERNDPGAAEAAAAAESWAQERELVDRWADADLDDFLAYRNSQDRDGRLNFSTDQCSAPVVGSTGMSFDFTDACLRHDFGYRNYKDLGLFEESKDAADSRFLEDMKDHCATRSIFLRERCYRWAYTFYQGVRSFG